MIWHIFALLVSSNASNYFAENLMELQSSTAKAFVITAAVVVVLAGIKAASAIMVPFLLSGFYTVTQD